MKDGSVIGTELNDPDTWELLKILFGDDILYYQTLYSDKKHYKNDDDKNFKQGELF